MIKKFLLLPFAFLFLFIFAPNQALASNFAGVDVIVRNDAGTNLNDIQVGFRTDATGTYTGGSSTRQCDSDSTANYAGPFINLNYSPDRYYRDLEWSFKTGSVYDFGGSYDNPDGHVYLGNGAGTGMGFGFACSCNPLKIKINVPSGYFYDADADGNLDSGETGWVTISKSGLSNDSTSQYIIVLHREHAPDPYKVDVDYSSNYGSSFTDFSVQNTLATARSSQMPYTVNKIKLVANAYDSDGDQVATSIRTQRRVLNSTTGWENVSGGLANMYNPADGCSDPISTYCAWSNMYNPASYNSYGIIPAASNYEYRWAVQAIDQHGLASVDNEGNSDLGIQFTPWGYFAVAQTPPPPPTYTLTLNLIGKGNVAASDAQVSSLLDSFKAYASHGARVCITSYPVTSPATAPTAVATPGTCVNTSDTTTRRSTGTYTDDINVSLTATAAAGWSFAGWTGAITSTASTINLAMDGNKTLNATFVTLGCSITSPAPNQGNVPLTTNVTATPTGNAASYSGIQYDFSFDNWATSLGWGSSQRTHTFSSPGVKEIRAKIKASTPSFGPVSCTPASVNVTVSPWSSSNQNEVAP